MHWIYTAVVCPSVSYGAIAWWGKTLNSTVGKKLTSLRRMATIAITGAIRTTPSESLEVLLDMLPLSKKVEMEAVLCADRLKLTGDWKIANETTTYKNLGTQVQGHLCLNAKKDWILRKYSFEDNYSVHLPTRMEWDQCQINTKNANEVWFTDGSKTSSGTGAGAYCVSNNTHISFSLGNLATVYQAEVVAILACAHNCLDKNVKDQKIKIFSDSQAALLALSKQCFSSSIVWECHIALSKLARLNKLSLFWVPGHRGVEGNEIADILAKAGSKTHFIGPEPVLGLPYNSVRITVRRLLQAYTFTSWQMSVDQRQARELNQRAPWRRAKELLSLSRNEIRTAIGLLTGHCSLNRHLSIMGVKDDPLCRACRQVEKSSFHVLCECDNYSAQRFEFLGYHSINAWEVDNIPIRGMLRFMSAIGLH